MAENSAPEPVSRGTGRPFPKGRSGNPGGRPRRLRELESAIEEKYVGPKTLEVIDKLYGLALAGDVQAARLFLDRVLGTVRPRPEVLPSPVPSSQTAELLQTSVRGVLAGQLAALEEKAENEGLTAAELSILTVASKAVLAADRDLENLRLLGSLGL